MKEEANQLIQIGLDLPISDDNDTSAHDHHLMVLQSSISNWVDLSSIIKVDV